MANKTAQDFKNQAREKGITEWPLRDCSICGYTLKYLIKDDNLYFDSGCDCVSYSNIERRDWQDLADHYNRQTNPAYIKKMDEFWGFVPDPVTAN